jgi:hypothetical protein
MDKDALRKALAACLHRQEKLLLCCTGEFALAATAQAVELGAKAVSWEPDLRWQNLLRLAILNRTRVAVGTGPVLLALSKLAKASTAPIPVHDVVLVGARCPAWMVQSIASSLDAQIWDCCMDAAEPQVRDPVLERLPEELLRWSSILDYQAERTEMGLSMELVVFPGKQLPQLPSGARVIVRPWDPGTDAPFQRP